MPDKHNERLSLLPPPCSWSDLFGSQTRPNPFSKTFNRCRCPRHPVDKFSFTQVVFGHQTGLRTTLPPQPGWAAFAPPRPPPPAVARTHCPVLPRTGQGPEDGLGGAVPTCEAATRATSSSRPFPGEVWRPGAPQVGPPTASRPQGPESPSDPAPSRTLPCLGPRESARVPPRFTQLPALPASSQMLRNRARTLGGLPGQRPEGPRRGLAG